MKMNIKRILIFFMLLIMSCVPEKEDNYFSNTFRNKVNSALRADSIVDIRAMTNSDWEELYIFNPYTPIYKIDSVLGFEWEKAEETLINQSDEFNLLVFVKQDNVVEYAKLPRSYGDFIRINKNGPFNSDNAKFKVKKELFGGEDWIFLYSN